MTIGQLKPGDTYGNGKYRVLSNDGYFVRILRIADNWRLEFHCKSVNWKFKLKKDDKNY